jgi:hypothetical protein
MKYSISTFTDLPLPVKAALLIASGASLGTVVLIIPSGARWIILIGLVVLVLLLLLYWYLLQWWKKRKVVPMERDLMKNTSAAPPVSGGDPKVVALLDDLRKKFERGIETFRANGKSLYDFPWYMVVGEPGSGKTEAVRHSNVGFPPGLQDTLQGAGGTLNMNWWFTDHAVILDTAGRMMFEQAELGGGHDWKEFLNLLKKCRRHCPINGVLLVIPADSLIRDTTDEIEQKANKIAQQFDVIQRTLNVRFPVFVVITKSDLINGFRDFFDNITDPNLQHQILGWSNPLPIDEPYRPDFIDQHVQMIKGRLFRRRLALMQQIICGESGVKEKRLADILYTFPQSLSSIAPRLARYLELIFRAGSKWSGKPLFFRGIYFTSSMREGSALDAELAETLGVPAESLPDGRVWERDRAYFLRDLLLKKVFPEQGLVTDAKDAKKQHFLRKTAILGTIAASLILLIIYTFLARNSYENRIGKLNNYLQIFINEMEDPNKSEKLFVVQADPEDLNYYTIMENVAKENLSGKLVTAIENFKAEWMFINWDSGTAEQLRDAAAFIYKTTVLEPFLKTTCVVMAAHKRDKADKWSYEDNPNELRALHQLIQIKAKKLLSEEETDSYSRSNFINNLSDFIIQHGMANDNRIKESRKSYDDNKSELHEPLRLEYSIFDANWPPASIMEDDPNSLDKAIEKGIDLFNQYWQGPGAVQDIKNLKNAVKEFNDAETRMLKFIRNPDDPKSRQLMGDEQLRQFPREWEKSFKSLIDASEKIAKHSADFNDPSSLKDLCEKMMQDVNDSYNFLLNELDPNSVQGNEFLGSIQADLDKSHKNITNELEECRKYLEPLEEKFWARIDEKRLYEIRFNMYSRLNERLIAKKKSDFDAIGEIENADKEARNALGEFLKGSGASSLSEASELCSSVLDIDKQLRLLSVLQTAPNDLEIKDLVEKRNNWDWGGIPHEIRDQKYDPEGAADVMNGWKYLGGAIDANFTGLKETYDDKGAAFIKYSKDYCNYWLGTLPEAWIESYIKRANNWAERSEQLRNLVFTDVYGDLENFGNSIRKALNKLQSHIPDNDQKKRDFDEHIERSFKELTYERSWKKILENWNGLSDDVFEVRKTLLKKKPDRVAEEYFPSPKTYRPDSPEEFVYMYWTKLTQNSLKILIEDADRSAEIQIDKILKDYGNKIPLKWDGDKELDPNEVENAYESLKPILLRENYEDETIGSGALPTEANYADLKKLLLRLSEPSVSSMPDKKRKRIERIWQVLQGLPMDQNPYYCKISLVSPISVVRTRRIEIEQNGIKKGRKSIDTAGSDEVCRVEYGMDKSIYINFYQYPDEEKDPNVVKQFGPFEGRWAILQILHLHPGDGKDVQICLPVPDKDENENNIEKQLYLKLEFFYDKDCKNGIPGFGQALLSKE